MLHGLLKQPETERAIQMVKQAGKRLN